MGQLSLVDDEEGGGQARLSVTSLVQLRRCPYRFHFTEIQGHGRNAPGSAALGLAVHRAIQTGEEPGAAAARYVDAFSRSGYADRRVVASELPIRLRRGDITVTGRIDAVFAHGEEGWELVDFKTGAPPSQPDAADDAQLEVYALAAAERYGRNPDQLVTTYLYLSTGEARTRTWSKELVAEAAARLDADLDRIRSESFPALANRGCPTCEALEECDVGLAALTAGLSSPSS